MSNVWSEEFSKNNNFAKFECNFAYIKKCLGTPLVWLMKVNSLYFLLNILFSRAVNLPVCLSPQSLQPDIIMENFTAMSANEFGEHQTPVIKLI